ncbi:ubiquitin system component Cue domain containing protein [Tieghemostelium lacteum]|uniref:Ubiquitin system component Cue domain containing protein n=1 Tax=Tieghemostelium lacteum TaxID=361077 RepID=A0A152A0P3_TIELA|nr:ubiquitin system component Cue domain containing protein [Tieghemostelium lacteum]|eukprot:KYQ99686.1 ubiquitin system component Cue domain containing protein [Tieghemostelium lacteum]
MVHCQTVTATGVTVKTTPIVAANNQCAFVYTLTVELGGGATAPANTDITVTSPSNSNIKANTVVGPTAGTPATTQTYQVTVNTPVGSFTDFVFSNKGAALTGGALTKVPNVSCTAPVTESPTPTHDSGSSTIAIISTLSVAVVGAAVVMLAH